MFTNTDIEILEKKGAVIEVLKKQIVCFEKETPYINLVRPSLIDDGIIKFTDEEIQKNIKFYEENSSVNAIVKFVPASGAATRMFKALFEFLQMECEENQKLNNLSGHEEVKEFLSNLQNFPFSKELMAVSKMNFDSIKTIEDGKNIIEALLSDNKLRYGLLPKALLLFHSYEGNEPRTSIEEHLVEGANYCRDNNNEVSLHFTVSREHLELINTLLDRVVPYYEKKFMIKYNICFSIQKPSTDTIAVDVDNNPFREEDGSILLRPGGHGALIENLNDLNSDVVFVKNIDNVVPDRLKEETYKYKKLIGGYMLNLRKKIFGYLDILNTDRAVLWLNEIAIFVRRDLIIALPSDYNRKNEEGKIEILISILNRPIRVCGMVKNEGDTGGGPFWTESSGINSVQIVESSQVDKGKSNQKEIYENSTHFNPVDLVCSIKDYKGEKFNLPDYIDNNAYFISKKSKLGKELKALELPGLWNGAMSDWISIFVEVPLITFNPVKTINDLLKKEHQ